MATKRNRSNPLLSTNPLTAAPAKKTKKDTAKRKLHEDGPGGLLIVRAPNLDAQPRTASQPKAGPSNPPPAKKFKAGSADPRGYSVDPVVERDVRAMNDEADSLRRRALTNTSGGGSSSMSFQSSPVKKGKGKRRNATVEVLEPLMDGTPQAKRNKSLREGAMAAIAREREEEEDNSRRKGHSRRSSTGGRGKRISNSFQFGTIALPHPRVTDDSFYKHIDRDIPDGDQALQLLVWSTSRVDFASSTPPLPPEEDIFKRASEQMITHLASQWRGLSLADEDEGMDSIKGTNAQNEKNKERAVLYSNEVQQAESEDSEWRKVIHLHESMKAKDRKQLEEWRLSRDSQIDERQLSDRLRAGLHLARAAPGPNLDNTTARLNEMRWKLDVLHTNLSGARTAARAAGRLLDERFEMLDGELAARAGVGSRVDGSSASGTALVEPRVAAAETRSLFRALSRVDSDRPPAQVGDAARKAAREVQRATASSGERERRVTLMPGGPPGTPKRPGTPRRDRTPGTPRRDRTPSGM
ncbi:unnamed protein product [Mycena citricolor]|uniref:Kinetochore protein mis13 n=1 Tax=Mycena citricolor TaxID=2018698 RepID=A0AAD2GVB8_9AGAR|nr:unnamed protein product [Mycena citricolor]